MVKYSAGCGENLSSTSPVRPGNTYPTYTHVIRRSMRVVA